MTSQNNTLRCAASTIYSMAGPNTPSGAVNAPTEDGCAWLDGIGSAPACCSAAARRALRLSCALVRARRRRCPPQAHTLPSRGGRADAAEPRSNPPPHPDLRRAPPLNDAPPRPAQLSLLPAVPSLSRYLNGSAPLQRHADISRQPSGIIDDF